MLSPFRLMATLRRWWLEVPPEWLFSVSFATLIAVGTAGLMWLPGLYTGAPLSLLDALFTATSAACVTGLTVVDPATFFTRAGQAWLLLLIQLGGLGLIGITSAIIAALGQRLSLRTEMILLPSVQQLHGQQLMSLTARVLRFTLLVEGVVALVLWALWIPDFGVVDAAWHAVFHAVNAFCNAGFSSFSNSLVSQVNNPVVLLTLSAAIILGGLGYMSTLELRSWSQHRRAHPLRRLSVHTYAVVVTSALLLVAGALAFSVLEWRGVLAELPVIDRLANAWFMSAVRTAGFNAVPYDQVNNGSALVTIMLMVIGGSPGSTAGGIKTTALAILAALAWSRIRGRRFVELYHRTIPDGTVQRTVSLIILFFITLATLTVLLSFSETRNGDVAQARQDFLPLMFEAASAVGTVGLSMGLTPSLSDVGRVLITLAMFIGRVGPLAFFAVISLRSNRHTAGLRPAAEDMIVG